METYAAQRCRLRCDCRVVYDGLCRGVVVFGTGGPAAAAGAGASGSAGSAEGGAGASGSVSGVPGGFAGSGRAGDATDETRALAEIMSIIEANKRYPRRARQTNQTGTVLLGVHVNAQGLVTEVEVLQKSASSLLNRAAKAAAKPLLGVKTKLKRAVRLEVPVRFLLTSR